MKFVKTDKYIIDKLVINKPSTSGGRPEEVLPIRGEMQ